MERKALCNHLQVPYQSAQVTSDVAKQDSILSLSMRFSPKSKNLHPEKKIE